MGNANFGGLAGAVVGGAVGYGMTRFLGTMELQQIDSVVCGSLAGCFSASMFGLLYDRSAVPEFRKSYRALTAHLYKGADADYDPRERIAFFGIPVAFATIIPVVLTPWLYAFKQDLVWVAMYVVASILCAVATGIIGNKTVEHRLLERQIAFNTTPVAESADKSVRATTTTKPMSPLKARMSALFCIAGGFGLLAMNHWSALHDHTYYPKAVFGGPMIIMVGFFALFEPRIMTRHLPIGKTYPKTVLLLMLLAMAIGVVGGYRIETYYH